MSNTVPSSQEFYNQRDTEIIHFINNHKLLGFQVSQIYEMLHRLTGLTTETIKQIRFAQERKLAELEDA